MWPFARRKSLSESIAISEHQKQVLDAVEELNDQLSKFVRWSYRNQKSTLEGLQKLQTEWELVRNKQDAMERKTQTNLEQVSQDLMGWIDDLDAVFQTAETGNVVGDGRLMGRWLAQLIQRLYTLGYEECVVQDKLFDPRTSEALGTTSRWSDNSRPPRLYEVVSVLRRGFWKDGVLHRKAQVIVYNGSDEENSGGFVTNDH